MSCSFAMLREDHVGPTAPTYHQPLASRRLLERVVEFPLHAERGGHTKGPACAFVSDPTDCPKAYIMLQVMPR